MTSLPIHKYIASPVASTTVVIRGADVTAGLYPKRADINGKTPPRMFAQIETTGRLTATVAATSKGSPFQTKLHARIKEPSRAPIAPPAMASFRITDHMSL